MRAGSVYIVRNVTVQGTPVVIPPDAPRDVEILMAVAADDGGVVFELEPPQQNRFPTRVRYHYCPAGALPETPEGGLEPIEAAAVFTGEVDAGLGQLRVPAPEIAPGDYDVALVTLFAE